MYSIHNYYVVVLCKKNIIKKNEIKTKIEQKQNKSNHINTGSAAAAAASWGRAATAG